METLTEGAMENQFDRGDQHPSVAEFFAYLHSELTPQEDCSLQEHLASCGDCCVLVLELETFCSEAHPEPSDAAASSGFEALWKELREIPSLRHISAPLRFSKTRQLRIAWTLAATLAVAVLGLGLRVKSLEPLAQPTANVAIVDLGIVTRGSGPYETRISANEERVVFLFHLDNRQYSSYRLRLLDATGAERLNLPNLKADQEWNVKLEIPRSSLPSGRVKFVLFGRKGTLEQQAGTYWVEVE